MTFRRNWLWLLLLLAMAAFFAGRQQALHLKTTYLAQPAMWDQQVYIWQRVWTPEHASALQQSHTLFGALRVLGLQAHPQEGWRAAAVNLALLQQDKRPVWLVVRLDGQLAQLDEPAIRQRVLQLVQQWRLAGLPVIGVEIDHDAGSARLAAYQQFLQQLRQQLPGNLQLSITALPTWLDSPLLPGVLQQVDSSVLQVHAVLALEKASPEKSLFDSALALRWLTRYAALTPHPFRVALPAYGMALRGFDQQAPLMESEVPLRITGKVQELTVLPATIADFLQRLAQRQLPHLQGIVWFRLPLASDRRAWSLSTLDAVIRQQPLTPHWQVNLQPQPGAENMAQPSQLYDITLHNSGQIDAVLPQEISIAASDCLAADATAHYRIASDHQQQRFIRISNDQLRAGQQQAIGWLRCAPIKQGDVRVIP